MVSEVVLLLHTWVDGIHAVLSRDANHVIDVEIGPHWRLVLAHQKRLIRFVSMQRVLVLFGVHSHRFLRRSREGVTEDKTVGLSCWVTFPISVAARNRRIAISPRLLDMT